MIVRHGGRIVINPGQSTFLCIAANAKSLRLKNLIEHKKFNIATTSWLRRTLGGDDILTKMPKLHPHDMLCCTPKLETEFTKNYDVYGDSYSEPINMLQIKALLNGIEGKVYITIIEA